MNDRTGIVAFLHARLDEWEKAIETASAYAVVQMGGSFNLPAVAIVQGTRSLWSTDDLRRAIESDRLIIETHQPITPTVERTICLVCTEPVDRPLVEYRSARWPCRTIRLMAARHRGHEDYEGSWAVSGST